MQPERTQLSAPEDSSAELHTTRQLVAIDNASPPPYEDALQFDTTQSVSSESYAPPPYDALQAVITQFDSVADFAPPPYSAFPLFSVKPERIVSGENAPL